MSINIDPEKFAELVVKSNPSKSKDAEDIAKESLELYINAYRLVKDIQILLLIAMIREIISELRKQIYNLNNL